MKTFIILIAFCALICTSAGRKLRAQVTPWPLPRTRFANNRIVGGSFASEHYLKGTALVTLYDTDFDSYLYVQYSELLSFLRFTNFLSITFEAAHALDPFWAGNGYSQLLIVSLITMGCLGVADGLSLE